MIGIIFPVVLVFRPGFDRLEKRRQSMISILPFHVDYYGYSVEVPLSKKRIGENRTPSRTVIVCLSKTNSQVRYCP